MTLAGIGGASADDRPAFLDFARTLRSPILYEAHQARPAAVARGPVIVRTDNRCRHYERLQRWPERCRRAGDAACAFNPIYGQGMTVAALDTLALHRCLRAQEQGRPGGDLSGLPRRFQQPWRPPARTPWLMATCEDLRYPTTEGARPGSGDAPAPPLPGPREPGGDPPRRALTRPSARC